MKEEEDLDLEFCMDEKLKMRIVSMVMLMRMRQTGDEICSKMRRLRRTAAIFFCEV